MSPAISKRSPMKSRACALLAALLITSGLTSCATVSSPARASLEIYQPRVLRLEAGQVIATRDGTYIPQADETWHSAAAYELLERDNLNLAAALAQERSRK